MRLAGIGMGGDGIGEAAEPEGAPLTPEKLGDSKDHDDDGGEGRGGRSGVDTVVVEA